MADDTTTADTGALTGISEQGQQVAEATGNSFQDIGKTDVPDYAQYDSSDVSQKIADQAPIEGGLSFVDQDKSTVAGQLNTLLNSESPYLQQAKNAGEKQAASRGMLNSSMSAGASQASAIQAALPIAQQDASTFAKAQSAEQAANYGQQATKVEGIVSGGLTDQNSAIAGTNQKIQNQFTAAMQSASEENKVFLQDMQNQHNTFLTQMEADHQLLLQRENTTAAKNELVTTQASAIMQNYQISVETMMTDPNFLNLGTEAVNKAIENTQNLAKNSIKFLGDVADVNLETSIDEYIKTVTEADQIQVPVT